MYIYIYIYMYESCHTWAGVTHDTCSNMCGIIPSYGRCVWLYHRCKLWSVSVTTSRWCVSVTYHCIIWCVSVTASHVWHDSFICVSVRYHCTMSHLWHHCILCVMRLSDMWCVSMKYPASYHVSCDMMLHTSLRLITYHSFFSFFIFDTYMTWCSHSDCIICGVSQWGITASYGRCVSVMCLIYMCNVTHSDKWHDSYICATWLI